MPELLHPLLILTFFSFFFFPLFLFSCCCLSLRSITSLIRFLDKWYPLLQRKPALPTGTSCLTPAHTYICLLACWPDIHHRPTPEALLADGRYLHHSLPSIPSGPIHLFPRCPAQLSPASLALQPTFSTYGNKLGCAEELLSLSIIPVSIP